MGPNPPVEPGLREDLHRALRLWVILTRAQAAVGAHARADIESRGLTVTEFGILDALLHKGPLLAGDLQRKILLSSGGVTYAVDRLAGKGLVERRHCESDRRAVWIQLTELGRERIEEIFEGHAHSIERALSALDPAGQEDAIRLLRTLGRGAAELPLR